jgi:hypothetical protein
MNKLAFSQWSLKRIAEGKKFCTSRKRYFPDDPRVLGLVPLPWWFIRNYLYGLEGADSPEELQSIMNQLSRRKVEDDEMFNVHFGDFRGKGGRK